ncbi:MAG: haloacid dehalogenase type II [Chloroflexi bacterium]|nr:haloacid dehalogenase type II [Chloroflexota bacterium]
MLDFNNYDALTFDCYGTLIDWESGIAGALRPVVDAHGTSVSDDELMALYAEIEGVGKSGEYRRYREVLRATVRGIGTRLGFVPSLSEVECLAGSIGSWQPFPDTIDALRRFQGKYRLCIVSNVDDDLFAGTARTLEVDFDYIVTAEQAGSYKPSHNNFAIAVARIGVPKERVLHVAESVKLDIVPAKSFGMDAVWVNRHAGLEREGSASGNPADGNSGADLEVPDLKTLADLMGL